MYINALYKNNRDIVEELLEFTPKKSINCQARTCAVLVSLVRLDLIDEALSSKDRFVEVVYGKALVQGSLF